MGGGSPTLSFSPRNFLQQCSCNQDTPVSDLTSSLQGVRGAECWYARTSVSYRVRFYSCCDFPPTATTADCALCVCCCHLIYSALLSAPFGTYMWAHQSVSIRKERHRSSFYFVLLFRLPSAVLPFFVLARGADQSLSLIDRDVKLRVPTVCTVFAI